MKTTQRSRSWFRVLATLIVAGAFVGSGFADDQTKTKPGAKPKAAKAPEVVRSQELDDVDGHVGKEVRSRSNHASATLTPSTLDRTIAKGLQASNTAASEPTNDEEFIRRVYLDVLGRLPDPGPIREFLASRVKNKRALLIESLLKKPEYAENWARYWRDVIAFRSPNENDKQANYPLFEKWLAGQFQENRPWDQIATSIITATGRNDENGATAFAIAEEGSAVEMAGEVSRIFLGIQIQCAQCHDHPNDPWKRQQFHEFAAFFGGVKQRRAEKAEKGQRQAYLVAAEGAGHYAMPDLKHPEKKVPVSPRFFLNDAPRLNEQVKSAERLKLVAGYVTSPENPWFARAFVNRIWYGLMGEGFYNPVDDLGPTRTPNSPEVLELVAEQWIDSGYDIRWLFRMILNTDAYQRASKATNTAAGRTPFASNVPSRLRADQIYEVLTHALDLNHDRDAAVGKTVAPNMEEMNATKGPARRDVFLKTFGVDPSMPNDDVLGTIPQALYLMNSPIITREVQARPNSMLGFLLTSHPDNRSVLELLYLRALGRRPTDREVRSCGNYLQSVGNRAEAFEDILWALLNSTEFLSRR